MARRAAPRRRLPARAQRGAKQSRQKGPAKSRGAERASQRGARCGRASRRGPLVGRRRRRQRRPGPAQRSCGSGGYPRLDRDAPLGAKNAAEPRGACSQTPRTSRSLSLTRRTHPGNRHRLLSFHRSFPRKSYLARGPPGCSQSFRPPGGGKGSGPHSEE